MKKRSRGFSISVLACAAALSSLAPAQAQVVKQLTHATSGWFGRPAIDDAGTVVFVNTSTNRFGGNPSHSWQLVRFDPATGNGAPATSLPGGVEDKLYQVSVSDDGQWVAFVSSADPLGQNHDRGPELFVMKEDATQLAQLTSEPASNAGSVTLIVMAGSGNKIAFVSTSDPLGSNPDHEHQVFIVNRNGTGLTQLTAVTDEEIPYLSISDDGQRVAFSHDGNLTGGNPDGNYELFAVLGDGTGLRQVTSFAGTYGCLDVAVSGNGGTIAFNYQGDLTGVNPTAFDEIYAIDWAGTNLRLLTHSAPNGAEMPSITDDGQWVFFHSFMTSPANSDGNSEIFRIRGDGTMLTNVTNSTGASVGGARAVVSGDGSRVICMSNRPLPGNTDGSLELLAMTNTGGSVVQLTDAEQLETGKPDITPDGSRIVFVSPLDLTGSDPDAGAEVFRVQADGSGLVQVTNMGLRSEVHPSISADGSTIVFSSPPTSSSVTPVIFRILAGGTGLVQLSSTSLGASQHPVIADGGSIVVFDNGSQIFRVEPDGTPPPVALTASSSFTSQFPRVDASGARATFESNADFLGENPDHSFEVYSIGVDGSSLTQVTKDPSHDSTKPDISATGSRIVYSSSADPLLTNLDHNPEIFLYAPGTGVMTQLTFTDEGESLQPRISGDGAYVYFVSTASFVEDEHDGLFDAYRVAVGSGLVERVGGLRFGDVLTGFLYYWFVPPFVVPDGNGGRAVLSAHGSLSGQNPDMFPEIYLVDRAQPAMIRVSGEAPTVISWDVESGPRRYDVIRGDVANLQAGPASTIDLGPVACLEDDSPDADTAGLEDEVDPAPGSAFFYLYRGSEGEDRGPGSYGWGSGGFERIAGTGDCSP